MKLPDLPEEDPKKKPKSDQLPKQPPKVVVHRGGPAHQPGDEERKPASLFGTRPTPRPAPSRPAPSRPIPTISAVPPDPEPPDAPAKADLFQPLGEQAEAAPSVTGEAAPRRNGSAGKGINPGLRLRAFEAAARNAPPAKVPMKYLLRPNRELTRRAYWDVAAALSLIVNAILVGVLLVMAIQLKNLKSTLNGLLGGLYSNFVQMDNAKINTTITVDTQIPLSFNLPISQTTDVTLTHSVSIPGAYVVLNGMSVPVNFTLPSGTNLPIALNMNIPVEANIPISLQVPVNIPLNQTELHAPFSGLQQTIRPLYCSFNRNAQYPQGFFICAGHDTPTPTTP
jgi:hypothetical protein